MRLEDFEQILELAQNTSDPELRKQLEEIARACLDEWTPSNE
jgi:hypothetical protein